MVSGTQPLLNCLMLFIMFHAFCCLSVEIIGLFALGLNIIIIASIERNVNHFFEKWEERAATRTIWINLSWKMNK
jgi:hypothetical protein